MTKAERTKQFILEQAAPIYNEKGISGTSVDDVLEATKLTKGSIYSHFENKEDLSIQVSEYLLDKVCSGISQAMKRETSAKGKIFAYMDFNKMPLNTFIKGGCPIFNIAVESDDNHALVNAKVNEVMVVSQKNFASILRAGINNGEFNSSLDPEVYAFKMFAAIEGGTVMCKSMNTDLPMRGLIKSLKSELESYEIK